MPTQQENSSQIEADVKSATSISHDNTVLKHFAIAITIIIFILIICIVIFLYKRKLRKLTNKENKDNIGSITHLRNIDDGEYNSLDYYSTDYVDSRIDHEQNEEVVFNPDETKVNRKFFIYAKNNAIMATKEFITRSNTYVATGNKNIRNNKNTKSLSDMKISKKDTSQLLVTTGNSSLKLNKAKNGSTLDAGQISSPVSGPSASIYNIERADSLANMTSRHAPSAPIIPPIPYTISNKKYKEILRGPQMTSVSNTSDLIYKNTHASDTLTYISRESQMTPVSNANDLTGNIDTFTNTNNTSSIISNVTPVILPKNLSIRSIRSNSSLGSRHRKDDGKFSRMVSDSLYLIKSSNTNSIISESQNDDKNESTIEMKDEDFNKLTTKEDEDVIDLEGSYERLSRETNLFQKPMYKIT